MPLHGTLHLLVLCVIVIWASGLQSNTESMRRREFAEANTVSESHGSRGKSIVKNGWLTGDDDGDEEDGEGRQRPPPGRTSRPRPPSPPSSSSSSSPPTGPSTWESSFDYKRYCAGREAVAGKGGAAFGGTAEGGDGGDARAIRLCRAYGGPGGFARSGLRKNATGGKGGDADTTDT
ncbi:hypothetical protein RvY_18787 [Ramazzottius varieornatus]|uniref:Uncharacterized protein n=1 Tax=Ramazzottius varieornatus TaxID=947166 RepID=A0A1D1W732_RAMVA|nr:hypothetical protein RvY_18787 [Ramazzottius varieornatus]